jgi:GrpB-like predicted nucleotidyltransferase (UPF0157 family)
MDAAVVIEPYNPEWPSLFAAERELLARALASWLAGPIEHVGSTAVPGLAAKPVIDIMAPVRSLEDSRAALPGLERLEYRYAPYRATVMHWLCKPHPEHRTHHLHLVPLGSALWNERIAFRERLRSDAALAREYERLKRQLAQRYVNDRESYTEAKGPFIERVLRIST